MLTIALSGLDSQAFLYVEINKMKLQAKHETKRKQKFKNRATTMTKQLSPAESLCGFSSPFHILLLK